MHRSKAIQLVFLLAIVSSSALIASTATKKRPPRVRAPKFNDKSLTDIFFRDIFREAIVGKRPDFYSGQSSQAVTQAKKEENQPKTVISPGKAWSKIISDSSLQDEIKRLKLAVDRDISTPQRFKGGDYQKARQHFSVLAMLFAITGEYDRPIRWQQDAPIARELFAKAGYNCKAGTDQSFQEAKQRKVDLQDLLSGGRIQASIKAEQKANWEKVCDRGPLMKQIEESHKKGLLPWTASRGTMAKNRHSIVQQAELIAAVAEALKQEGMQDADDDEYRELCDALLNSARGVVQAIGNDDHGMVRQELGKMTISCDDCHENYR